MRQETLMEKYFTYQGRINRKRFIFRSLAVIIASGVFSFIAGFILVLLGIVSNNEESLETVGSLLGLPFSIAAIMLSIRRWHDTNHSGWWFLIGFIPIINLYAIYMLYFKKGTDGTNDFGEDPLSQW